MLALVPGVSRGQASDISLAAGGADLIWHGSVAGALAGTFLDQGDLNGDGRKDLIIGSPGSGAVIGTVSVIFGGPVRTGDFSLASADVIITGAAAGDGFGTVTAAGNILALEGSGPRDLVVGAPSAQSGRGVVYLFRGGLVGGARLTTADAVLQIIGAPGDHLGTALATGDLNQDGHREIIIGAPGNQRIYIINGAAALSGTRDLSTTSADTTITGSGIGSVIAAGDVTGDSVYDLLIGAPSLAQVYLLRGIPLGFGPSLSLPGDATSIFTAADPTTRAGSSIKLLDLDGDGGLDIAIGAPGASGPSGSRPGAGEVDIMWGIKGNCPVLLPNGACTLRSTTLDNADVILYGPAAGDHLGSDIASGDINRDTPNDLLALSVNGPNSYLAEYYGRSRSQIGTLTGSTRIVDLAVAGQMQRRIIGDPSAGAILDSLVFEVTGEGARDIIAAAPNANSNAGNVYFVISPKLQLAPLSMTLTAGEGQLVSSTLTITNPSPISIGWIASTSPAWLTASPAAGTAGGTTPGALTLTADSEGLAPGSYSGSVNVTSTSPDLTMTRTATVALTVTASRFSSIDTPAAGTTLAQPFTVTGWAIDTGTPSGTGVDRVDVYAYVGTSAVLLGTATYGLPNAFVASTYGARFVNSGFTFATTGVPAGSVRIAARAHSPVTGAFWEKPSGSVVVTVQPIPSGTDLNGDKHSDLLWRNVAQGWISAWFMNGSAVTKGLYLTPNQVADTSWRVAAMADFNGDGKLDIIWQNDAQGWVSVWFMNGTTMAGAQYLTPNQVADTNWKIVSAADFNGDGKPDLLWWNQSTGMLSVWLMNGTQLIRGVYLTPNQVADTNWVPVGTGDFNGDGKPDILWRNKSNGMLAVWLMNGLQLMKGVYLSPNQVSDTNWEIRAIIDLNGDGKPDLVWQNRTEGWLTVWYMNGTQMFGAAYLTPNRVADTAWVIMGPK